MGRILICGLDIDCTIYIHWSFMELGRNISVKWDEVIDFIIKTQFHVQHRPGNDVDTHVVNVECVTHRGPSWPRER